MAKKYYQNQPIRGGVANRSNEGRFLFAAYFDPHGIDTLNEHVASWQRFSRFNFHFINLWPNSGGGSLAIPKTVDLEFYDGIFAHNTTSYCPTNLFNLDSQFARKFRHYGGVKGPVKQDEHYHAAAYAKFVQANNFQANNFNVLVTCLPPAEVEKV